MTCVTWFLDNKRQPQSPPHYGRHHPSILQSYCHCGTPNFRPDFIQRSKPVFSVIYPLSLGETAEGCALFQTDSKFCDVSRRSRNLLETERRRLLPCELWMILSKECFRIGHGRVTVGLSFWKVNMPYQDHMDSCTRVITLQWWCDQEGLNIVRCFSSCMFPMPSQTIRAISKIRCLVLKPLRYFLCTGGKYHWC